MVEMECEMTIASMRGHAFALAQPREDARAAVDEQPAAVALDEVARMRTVRGSATRASSQRR